MATIPPDSREIDATPAPEPKRVGLVSLGCPKALVDSERILTRLRADGYAMSPDYAGADVVLVNTCGFLDSAKEESLAAIGEAIAENGRVIVTGCMGNEAETIRARFPDHTIISEEAGGGEISSGYTWVVDPLDGTTNYAHRHPVFAVSIGVLERGEPLIGVIHDPLRDQTFVAERGGGARFNGAPMHVSRVAGLRDALVGLDWGHADEVRERILVYLHRVVPRCGTLRVLGSATLALAYVGAGWLDAYFHLALQPWDAAAGMLIVAEAGGRCGTLIYEAPLAES